MKISVSIKHGGENLTIIAGAKLVQKTNSVELHRLIDSHIQQAMLDYQVKQLAIISKTTDREKFENSVGGLENLQSLSIKKFVIRAYLSVRLTRVLGRIVKSCDPNMRTMDDIIRNGIKRHSGVGKATSNELRDYLIHHGKLDERLFSGPQWYYK